MFFFLTFWEKKNMYAKSTGKCAATVTLFCEKKRTERGRSFFLLSNGRWWVFIKSIFWSRFCARFSTNYDYCYFRCFSSRFVSIIILFSFIMFWLIYFNVCVRVDERDLTSPKRHHERRKEKHELTQFTSTSSSCNNDVMPEETWLTEWPPRWYLAATKSHLFDFNFGLSDFNRFYLIGNLYEAFMLTLWKCNYMPTLQEEEEKKITFEIKSTTEIEPKI